jgi:hypothetical protein
MTLPRIPRGKILPAIFHVRVIIDDLKEAICGSPTRCALANAIRRMLDPAPTFVTVKANRVTITWHQMLHHFELPNRALKLVAQNDDGTLSFMPGESRVVKLPRVRVRPAHVDLSPKRREQIKASNERRKGEGKKSSRNPRWLASKQQGVALKHLHAVAAKAKSEEDQAA